MASFKIDETTQAIGRIFNLAGVDLKDLEVLSCHIDDCIFQENREAETPQLLHSKSYFEFLNKWFELNRSAAKNRISNSAPLFRAVTSDWVLVDSDNKPGPDGILYKKKSGWQFIHSSNPEQDTSESWNKLLDLARKLILKDEDFERINNIYKAPDGSFKLFEYLAAKSWSDFGFHAEKDVFMKRQYPFVTSPSSSKHDLISPRDKIVLKGNPDTVVPWTDPYLLAVWENFIQEMGAKLIRKHDGEATVSKYYFKDLLFGELTVTLEKIHFRFFTPLGALKDEITLDRPKKPQVSVTLPSKDEKKPPKITIYGKEVEVLVPQQGTDREQVSYLKTFGKAIQEVPKSMALPLFEKVKEEDPVRIVLADREVAQRIGITDDDPMVGGNYNLDENRLWIDSSSQKLKVEHILHEWGHAFSDFIFPENNLTSLSNVAGSFLGEYHGWKVAELFKPEEIVEYDRLVQQYGEEVRKDHYSWERLEEIKDKLKPFRKRIAERFVSNYAVEGSGLANQMKFPSEDFAEIFVKFIFSLNQRENYHEYRSREPFFDLLGLYYLFSTYHVDQIGSVRKDGVFSEKAFETVTRIQIDSMKVWEMAAGAIRPGFSLAYGQGVRALSLEQGGNDLHLRGMSMALHPGYRWQRTGMGFLLEVTVHRHEGGQINSYDLGLWAQLATDIGFVTFFLEANGGLRKFVEGETNYLENAETNPFWLGTAAGLGVFGGLISLIAQSRSSIYPLAGWVDIGAGVYFDIPYVFRKKYF